MTFFFDQATNDYYITAETQMGLIRAHELRLRQDQVTGDTPVKKEQRLLN